MTLPGCAAPLYALYAPTLSTLSTLLSTWLLSTFNNKAWGPQAIMTPKMEFFNFVLEQKLDRHSSAEFHSDSDGDGFNFL